MDSIDKIQLGCAKYIYPNANGQTTEIWECYGNEQCIQASGKTPQEALGFAILEIVEYYKDLPGRSFVIDAISIRDEPITIPSNRFPS